MPRDAPLPLHIEGVPPAMADQPRSKVIKDNSIRNGLDAFRASFNPVCAGVGTRHVKLNEHVVETESLDKYERLYGFSYCRYCWGFAAA